MSTEDKRDVEPGDEQSPPPEPALAPAQSEAEEFVEGAQDGCAAPVEEFEETSEGAKPPEVPVDQVVAARVCGVCFIDGKVMEFDPRDLRLAVGDQVVVDNDRDLNLGRVVFVAENSMRKQLRRVIRRVVPEDLMLIRRNQKREEEALGVCNKCIAERGLPMKLIRAAYLHGGNKAIFYFSAEGRVDFRALVRDLAQQLHVRIEMRQIGVRDESKMLGGVGICGQQLCCSRYLRKFQPVSIKMAKNQNLALNPQKLSGVCSRLMCCLVYEDATYRELKRDYPKPGSMLETPKGTGKVVDLDILGGRVMVQLPDEDRYVVFTLQELRGEDAPRPPASGAEEERGLPEESEELVPGFATEGPDESRQPAPADRLPAEGQQPREGRRRRRRRGPRPAVMGQGQGGRPAGAQPVVPAAGGGAGPEPEPGSGKRKRKRRRRSRHKNRSGSNPPASPGGNP